MVGEIQQHHIGAFLHSFEGNFTAARRDVEVVNVEVGSEVGQLPLGVCLQVDGSRLAYHTPGPMYVSDKNLWLIASASGRCQRRADSREPSGENPRVRTDGLTSSGALPQVKL
jgi:hypothetical protein